MRAQIVLVDIDGCLLPKGNFGGDLLVLEKIKQYNRKSRIAPKVPAVTLCSGRPAPYVEALMKLIEGYIPAIFEWGAGIYFPASYDFQYSALFTEEVRAVRQEILDITTRAIKRGEIKAKIQPGKEVAITLYPVNGVTTDELYKTLKQQWICIKGVTLYEIQVTQTRIDLLPVGIKKDLGILALGNILNLDPENILGIGDDESDLSFLNYAGLSGCPINAHPKVKEKVDYVSPLEHGFGVIDILEHFLN
jgi:hypothetical protein